MLPAASKSATGALMQVDVYVSNRLPLYADMVRLDVKRSILGPRLFAQVVPKDEAGCPG
jgi:hypothetical protein